MSRPPYIAHHVAPGERRATAADIVASVQREIASGELPAGSRLPPVRALEKQLGLSKNTAQAAYDELVARPGRGPRARGRVRAGGRPGGHAATDRCERRRIETIRFPVLCRGARDRDQRR